jgi:hypothetical protein
MILSCPPGSLRVLFINQITTLKWHQFRNYQQLNLSSLFVPPSLRLTARRLGVAIEAVAIPASPLEEMLRRIDLQDLLQIQIRGEASQLILH